MQLFFFCFAWSVSLSIIYFCHAHVWSLLSCFLLLFCLFVAQLSLLCVLWLFIHKVILFSYSVKHYSGLWRQASILPLFVAVYLCTATFGRSPLAKHSQLIQCGDILQLLMCSFFCVWTQSDNNEDKKKKRQSYLHFHLYFLSSVAIILSQIICPLPRPVFKWWKSYSVALSARPNVPRTRFHES